MAAKDLGIGITITLRDNLSSGAKKAGDGLDKLKEKSEGSVNSFKKMQNALNAAAGSQIMTGAKRAFGELVSSTTDFQREMGQVATQVDRGKVDMNQLRKGVQELSVEFGISAIDEAKGLYEGLSAGIGDAAETMSALRTANQLAVGGNATVGESIDALTTIINAWGISAKDTEKISDSLFKTVLLGKLNVSDLARNIADVAPVASSLGINLEQVGASIATMTKQGTKAPEAFTGMKSVISGLIRPSDELMAVWRKAGFTSAEAAIRAKGYQGALELVTKAAKGNKGTLQTMMGGAVAMNAVLQITGDKAGLFAESLAEVKDSAGAAANAFKAATEGEDFQIRKSQQSWENLKRAVGGPMLQALRPVIEKFTELAKAAGEWLEKNPTWAKAIGITIAGLTALAVILGVVAAAIFIVEIIASPVILIILGIAIAIGLVVAAGWWLYNNWEEIVATFKMWIKALGLAWGAFVEWLKECMSAAGTAVGGWVTSVVNWFKGIIIWLGEMAMKFLEFLEMMPLAGDLASDLRSKIGNFNMEMKVSMQPASPWMAMQNQAAQSQAKPTMAYGGMGTFTPGQGQGVYGGYLSADLLAVKNPSTNAAPGAQKPLQVNVPKTVVNPASIQIDKREIAKVVFDVQQEQAARQ